MMKNDLSRFAPPGYDLRREQTAFLTAIITSAAFFLLCFLVRYIEAWNETFFRDAEGKLLALRSYMPGCRELLRYCNLGLLVTMAAAAVRIPTFYMYFYADSKSIYTMRRIGKPMELHLRCWTVPVLTVLLCAAALAVMTLLCFGLYLLMTPKEYTVLYP